MSSKVIHTYDRGEGNEEYLFATTDDETNPLVITDKDGLGRNVLYDGALSEYTDYLMPTNMANLKATTIQDRTFIVNKEKTVGITSIPALPGETTETSTTLSLKYAVIATAYNKYAQYIVTANVTLAGTAYTLTSAPVDFIGNNTYIVPFPTLQNTFLSLINSIPGYNAVANGNDFITVAKDDKSGFTASASVSTNVTIGALVIESSASMPNAVSFPITTTPAFYWAKRASGDDLHPFRYVVYLNGTTYQAVSHESDTAMNLLVSSINSGGVFTASAQGSIIRISKANGAEFTFSSWDSWGNQASFGWKGSVAKLSDLPSELGWTGQVVQITGDDDSEFTDYFVKSTESAWIETRDPDDDRGYFQNMPLAVDRLSDGSFKVQRLNWELPKVGDIDTNPNPSFVGSKLTDVFFYKNRLGMSTADNVVLSETGGYYNFYIKTVLSILDTDPIDVAIASSTASQIQFVKPFQSSLYIFTKESQFEMVSLGVTSPTTVSMEVVSNYPMDINVSPVVDGTSLFFISTSENRRQLREYRKNNETLVVSGIDLNITTPTLISQEVSGIILNGVLGYIFVTTKTNEIYFYCYKDSGGTRVQSAWSKWVFYENNVNAETNSYEYGIFGSDMWILHKTVYGDALYSIVNLTKDATNETVGEVLYPSITLYPSLTLFPGGATYVDLLSSGQFPFTASIQLPQWYPHTSSAEFATPKDKILLKKLSIQGSGNFDASIYRYDYATTYLRSHVYTSIRDLDVHINTRVDNCDITISDNTSRDFLITSFVLEGLYQQTSKAIR